jgi:hypothetical protein
VLNCEFQLDCANACAVVHRGGPVNQPGLSGDLAAVTHAGLGAPDGVTVQNGQSYIGVRALTSRRSTRVVWLTPRVNHTR